MRNLQIQCVYWTGAEGLQDEQYNELYNIIVHHEHLRTIAEHLVQCSEHMVPIVEHLVPKNFWIRSKELDINYFDLIT